MSPAPLVAVVGATASGKSDLAVRIALALEGEVVNADALQLYRGMDIGTAKLPFAERSGVPHHLLDVLDVTQEASVEAYQRDARAAIADIRARGRTPVLVGGSGLYVRAVLDDIVFPPTDPEVRTRWERTAREIGAPALHAHLASLDPEAAAVLGPRDERRIVRALEVNELTGRSYRAFLPSPRSLDPQTVQIALARPRAALHDRIGRRVEHMFAAGLLEETRSLRAAGLEQGQTARRAIGYEQALAVLDHRMGLEEAREATAAGTRRLVRKQDTWFRRDPRVHWIEADDGGEMPTAAALEVIRAAAVSSKA